jgi:HK97 family phage major capsid protein
MNRLKEIEQRKAAIRTLLQGTEQVDLDALETELRTLETEEKDLRAIEKRKFIAAGITAGEIEGRSGEVFTPEGTPDPAKESRKLKEQRGKDLIEGRSVTVGSSSVVLPVHKATDIKPTFNEVSSLIDRVTTLPLPGGESFTQPYSTGFGEGGTTAEGGDATTADPTFGYATIGKAKVTAYSEDSEEVKKLPAADYDGVVMDGITKAVRKRLTKQILIGTGATNHLAGIFSTAATAIDIATDLEIAAIDEDTLDDIIYGFGGDEDVEDVAVLVLNKKDLKSFATLRDADGKKLHAVKPQGNTGTIDGVPYIINSACKAVTDAANPTGSYAMAYGPLSNYTLTVFSDLDVQRSTDFLFKSGMIAHKGVIFAGGNVTAKNGFLRVKKA